MPKLYHAEYSAPARAARMVAKALGVTLTLQEVNLLQGAQFQPEYLQLNPTHTVPTLDDNGFVVFDSHAISMYLSEQYAKDDKLYPKDPKKRAVVNQVIYLDTGTLFTRFRTLLKLLTTGGVIPEDNRKEVHEAYGYLEAFLNERKFLAADCLTIADIIVVSTVAVLDILVPLEAGTTPKLAKWFKDCQALPWYSENVKGLEMFRGMLKAKSKS